jgi:hypothetical protein
MKPRPARIPKRILLFSVFSLLIIFSCSKDGDIFYESIGENSEVLFSKKSAESYRTVFRDCTAKGVARNSDNAVISLKALSTVNTFGRFVFDNFNIEYDRDVPFMRIGTPSSGFTVNDIQGDFTIKVSNDNPVEYVWGYNKSKNVNASISYDHC